MSLYCEINFRQQLLEVKKYTLRYLVTGNCILE